MKQTCQAPGLRAWGERVSCRLEVTQEAKLTTTKTSAPHRGVWEDADKKFLPRLSALYYGDNRTPLPQFCIHKTSASQELLFLVGEGRTRLAAGSLQQPGGVGEGEFLR